MLSAWLYEMCFGSSLYVGRWQSRSERLNVIVDTPPQGAGTISRGCCFQGNKLSVLVARKMLVVEAN
jgi:hypothetical protein